MSLRELASAFTLEDARAAGISKDQVYSLLEKREIERVGRGVFVRPDSVDPAFIAIAAATAIRNDATLCLTSALVYHDLSDAIPFASDIALPRGTHQPAGLSHVNWHSFDVDTFHVGREHVDALGSKFAVYSAERSIVDSFRLMHLEGNEAAYEALRRWIRKRGTSPAGLLKVARSFPKTLPRIRQALDVLG